MTVQSAPGQLVYYTFGSIQYLVELFLINYTNCFKYTYLILYIETASNVTSTSIIVREPFKTPNLTFLSITIQMVSQKYFATYDI